MFLLLKFLEARKVSVEIAGALQAMIDEEKKLSNFAEIDGVWVILFV